MKLTKIAVAGPGGNVGSVVIKDLLATGEFEITAVIRPTSQYADTAPQRVRVVTADFNDPASLATALHGQDAVLSLLPGTQTMLHQQRIIVDAAIAAGVKLFFADEFSGNLEGPHYLHFPTSMVGEKLLVREYLLKKAESKEIAWTSLNGGPFFDMWFLGGYAGFDVPKRTARIYGTGNNLSCWTPISMISKAMVNMLRNPDPFLNRAVFVSGVKDLTQNAILGALESELGAKFEVEHVDIDRIKKDAFEALEKGDLRPATRGLTLNYNFNEKEGTSNFWFKVENEMVGIEPITVQEALREVMKSDKFKNG